MLTLAASPHLSVLSISVPPLAAIKGGRRELGLLLSAGFLFTAYSATMTLPFYNFFYAKVTPTAASSALPSPLPM